MGVQDSQPFITHPSLIVEEKLDGTNVGIHFSTSGRMVLQCRGHEITEGMHPQYDLFKQWTAFKRPLLEAILGDRYILFGEWLYARHSVFYRSLPHYFFEFDIYDKEHRYFLRLIQRQAMLEGTGIHTVPVLRQGAIRQEDMPGLIQPSAFGSTFDNPVTNRPDNLMEGLYLRIEDHHQVIGRAKIVRPEFVERIKLSQHWQHQKMVPNQLSPTNQLWA